MMNSPINQLLIMLALLAAIQRAGAQTFLPLYSFTDGNDGANPVAGLVQASDGNLYGTTHEGGTNDEGAIFRISTNGGFTPLYSFTGGHDGAYPRGGLVQAGDGNLYGAATGGGTNFDGTVFRIATNGAFTPLYSFTGGHDGAFPESALVQAIGGDLYGTAYTGGTNGDGTVFRITTNGVFTPLYSFTGTNDGAAPAAGLVQASDGNLYGTTEYGGITNVDSGYGAVFRITTNGVFTPLYSFTDGHDGAYPEAALVQAGDGNLYGTTYGGGTNGYGVVFRITTNNVLTPLYSFADGHDGADPYAGLVRATDGNLYGTAPGGGTNGDGTVFELTLPPSSPPVLSILSHGNQSVLSWPASASNYVLQSTTNLASPNWVTVSIAIPTNSVTVTNSSPAQYFRLANP